MIPAECLAHSELLRGWLRQKEPVHPVCYSGSRKLNRGGPRGSVFLLTLILWTPLRRTLQLQWPRGSRTISELHFLVSCQGRPHSWVLGIRSGHIWGHNSLSTNRKGGFRGGMVCKTRSIESPSLVTGRTEVLSEGSGEYETRGRSRTAHWTQ